MLLQWTNICLFQFDDHNICCVLVEAIVFTKELSDIELSQMKQKAVFECEISKSGLRLEWYKGERKLRSDDKYEIEAVGKTHRLVINDVVAEDVDEYKAVYEKLSTAAKLSLAGKQQAVLKITYSLLLPYMNLDLKLSNCMTIKNTNYLNDR